MVQCKGLTKDGSRCKRAAIAGTEYCSLHTSKSKALAPAKKGKTAATPGQKYYACVVVPTGQPAPRILSVGVGPKPPAKFCTSKNKTETVHIVGFSSRSLLPEKTSPNKATPTQMKGTPKATKKATPPQKAAPPKKASASKQRKAAKPKVVKPKAVKKAPPKQKEYVPSSHRLEDMREDWLAKKATKKQIEDAIRKMWSVDPDGPTWQEKGLHSIVMRHVDFLDSELRVDPDMEEEYPQSVDFGMLYDLKEDEMEYYPIYGPYADRFDRDAKLDNMVMIYAK